MFRDLKIGIFDSFHENHAKTSMSSPDPFYQLTQPGTPTTATGLPGDPTMNHPYYMTSGTSTEIILNHQSAPANMTDSCARDTMTSCDPPHQSRSARTPAAAADLPENLLPHHNTRTQIHAGIILCLPAQQTRAKTSNSRPIPTKRPPKNLASSSHITGSLALKPEASSTTFWTACHRCRMLYEYINIFLNQEILCHECKVPLMATKVPAPSKARILKSLSDALRWEDC